MKLEELGGATVENIKKLDYKLRNKCFAAFRDARKEDDALKEIYDTAADDAARRAALLQFVIDAAGGELTGKNTTTVSRSKKQTRREVWLTQSQLAGPHPGLNSSEDAAAAVKTATPRPHKTNSGLRRAGINEYQHVVEFEE